LLKPQTRFPEIVYPQRVVRVSNLNVRQLERSDPAARPEAGSSCHRAAPRIRGNVSPAKIFRGICFFISTTLLSANLAHLAAQQVTTVAPPPAAAQISAAQPPAQALPDAPAPEYPDAVPIPPPAAEVHLASDTGSTSPAGIDILDGHVVITYRDRVLEADHIEYNSDTGDVTLTGHVVITLGESDEHIEASHGTINIHSQTGTFYDVTGSVGARRKQTVSGAAIVTQRAVYANGNPFLFTGRMVVKTGPRQYQIFNGTITSCQLPSPDWLLSGAEFSVDGAKAHARNTVFRLMNIPVLWLPYVTHPVDASDRQTGILIPEFGINSASKGDTIGEQVYWAINRSADITLGALYYSARGYEETGSIRYRGLGQDFALSHFSSLQDRGYTPTGGTYINQSGTDALFSARYDLLVPDEFKAGSTPARYQPVQARAVADVEYLSSFPYREAFSSNFNQAVSTDVLSTIYFTREANGLAAALEGDRYQGEKRVANTSTTPPQTEEQVHIFHAPALEFAATDHLLGSSGLEWNLDTTAAALKRTQPNFETSGMIERLDIHPELAYPFGGGGWRIRPAVAGRETFYSRSRQAGETGPGGAPVESTDPLNRADIEMNLDIRPPVLVRTFDSGFLRNLFGHDFRHTIQPQIVYRYVHGINNFNQVLRFDTVDIASDTNELEYGVTQRLFLRRKNNQPCRAAGSYADASEILGSPGEDASIEDPGQSIDRVDTTGQVCGDREWISWRLAQKYFFDPNFGGAVVNNGPRDILATTLNFSGISFLTGPRNISPIVSRLRIRPSDKVDLEWDFDFDTCSSSPSPALPANATRPCESKFTSNNIYIDVHQGNIVSGLSYARLNAPARSYVDGVLSSVADFDQMRVHFGFGNPAKRGLSAAASAGIDIDLGTVQYGAIQTSYNWNCCGLSVEYRKYELGTARNDNGYKFNFTLANIGSAGNLRHADQVF
jgi:LPS-assembly protein